MKPKRETFWELWRDGDVEGARDFLQRHDELPRSDGYEAHPLLRECVHQDDGHCYKPGQLVVSDLLIRETVRRFRNAVLEDQVDSVRDQLRTDPELARAEFTAGRGLAQAIHHWKSIAVAELLLNAGADLDALTTVHRVGETPLCMQLRFGTLKGVRFLLKRGANPNRGMLKFMPARSMLELVKLLIDHGWQIDEGAGERTLLHHEAQHGSTQTLRTVLDHGADPNGRDANGRTALHLVAARGTGREAIRVLVAAGADLRIRDTDGNVALDLARRASRQSATDELLSLAKAGP